MSTDVQMRSAFRSRAPIRIDLAGGWTDVPPYSSEQGGAVVNAAINRFAYCTLRPRPDQAFHIYSADFDATVHVTSFADLVYDGTLDLIKAAIRRLDIRQGLELYVRCDAPPGSGTGSSAAMGVALLGVLNLLQTEKLSAHEMARLAHLLEIEELRNAGGKQDQYAAALGGVNFMEFHDPAVEVSPLHLAPATRYELEKRLVMCYTGRSRVSGNIISTVMGAYRAGVPRTVQALHALKRIAVDMKSALLRGDLASFGELLQENWENQKQLDPSVTNSTIDELFELARRSGAQGGKALGAGGGGCVLFYAVADQEHRLRLTLAERGLQLIEFTLDFEGVRCWQGP